MRYRTGHVSDQILTTLLDKRTHILIEHRGDFQLIHDLVKYFKKKHEVIRKPTAIEHTTLLILEPKKRGRRSSDKKRPRD